ncbi:MAG: type VI secretion system Vgr family protein, partial [Gemmatimonadota bacterium]
MPEYTQANLPMRIDTVLDEDVLLLNSFSGTEAISKPFTIHLDLLSEDPEIDPDELLRSEVLLSIDLPDGSTRPFHGHISQFVQLGRSDELTHYQAEMVPWLWFLSLSQDCRIFQEMDVLEIVEEIFSDLGYSDFDVRCVRNYPKRQYCVQYRESHLNFISRLLEEEGIFYFFEHSDSGHVMVIADDNSSIQPSPGAEEVRIMEDASPGEDVVHSLRRKHAVHLGRVTLRDYDYLKPSLQLESSVSGEEWEEAYDYPGKYSELEDGDRYSRLRLEESEMGRQMVRGRGACRGFQSGFRFDLAGHYRADANTTYALVEIRHDGSAGGYRSDAGPATHYSNEFLAIPHEVPFRPPHRAERPRIQGTQTAEVVGPSGEEIWVDEHSRIKVQFHWDRRGEKDENSSCWIRVASTWAGKSWGAIEIPRIGQEVLV